MTNSSVSSRGSPTKMTRGDTSILSHRKGSLKGQCPIGMPLRCLDLKSCCWDIPQGEGGHHYQRDHCLEITGKYGKSGIAPGGVGLSQR